MYKTKKWFRSLFRRRMIVASLVLLQILLIVFLAIGGSSNFIVINNFLTAISFVVAIFVIANKEKKAYKIIWLVLLLVFPVFGGLFYLLFRFQSSTRRITKKQKYVERISKDLFFSNRNCYDGIVKNNKNYSPLITYLQQTCNYPIYENNKIEFLESGEVFFDRLLKELKKAKKYIFLEYFIVHEGKMWNSILEILKEKVKQGVEVRVMYDDMGCFLLLPNNYKKILEEYGIKCVVFNEFRPFLTAIQNNRDHRKLAIIDGIVSFTGGINLADEYINEYDRYGHWKDCGVVIEGDASWSFTLMYLQLWSICKNDSVNYLYYYPCINNNNNKVNNKCYLQPYCDSPIDSEFVSEEVYLSIINSAKDYLYINTPYLIIDDNMIQSLTKAAKSGVDVRITVPFKCDKKLIHFTTRSYYYELIKSGVKIYEYSSGFIHSKTFISDDLIATNGTVNLDFRSLYLHFECGVCIYDKKCITDMKKDFITTLEKCKEVTLEDCKKNIIVRFLQNICKLFAPLM